MLTDDMQANKKIQLKIFNKLLKAEYGSRMSLKPWGLQKEGVWGWQKYNLIASSPNL